MATTPDLQEPLITAARAQAWHQAGDAILTLEAARSWLEQTGMLLFAPRGGSLGAPAPSLVEATLGTEKATSTLAEGGTARTLVARLVGEGSAVPLNLFGGPGDLPDFLVSPGGFPFVFTLRGDKGWKRPPETSGSVKVTPLGLRVYELLAEKGALTVGDIVSEVGREVTESAVARALSELWQMLRVLPVLQQGEGDTLWELTTSRFLKAVKAGANAGQPTALSALTAFYLGQALVATEEEIAAFLSPLTARSRVRDVLHALIAGRQLAEGVVNGKTVLYMPDALPDFAAFAPTPDAGQDVEQEAATAVAAPQGEESTATGQGDAPRERIQRFQDGGSRPQDRNLRGKPIGRGKPTGAFREKLARPGSSRAPRDDRGGDRAAAPRRPFSPRADRPERSGNGPARRPEGDRPSFSRPWDEEGSRRTPRGDSGSRPSAGADARRSRPDRPARPGDTDRPRREDTRPPQDRPAGDRPFRDRSSGGRPFRPRPEGGDRPFRPRPEGGDRPFRPRTEGGGDRPFRARSEGGDRPFRSRSEGDDRPFRSRSESGDRPFRPRPEGGDRSFRPRPESGGDRPFRPRPEGGDRPFRPRPEGGDRPFRPRPEGGDRPFRTRPEGGDRPFRPRPEGGDRPFRSRSESGDRPFRSKEGAGGDRRGNGRPPSRFGAGSAGGSDRPRSFRPASGGVGRSDRSTEGGRSRPSFGARSEGQGSRGSDRPGGRGGFRPAGSRPGGKPSGRPDRPPRTPRPEDPA